MNMTATSRWTMCLLLAAVGVLHLLPIIGVLGTDELRKLYGLNVQEQNLLLLMRHRAVLLGLLGGFLLCAACVPKLQWLATIAGLASVASFIWLSNGEASTAYSPQIQRVVIADWAALGALLLCAGLLVLRASQNRP